MLLEVDLQELLSVDGEVAIFPCVSRKRSVPARPEIGLEFDAESDPPAAGVEEEEPLLLVVLDACAFERPEQGEFPVG